MGAKQIRWLSSISKDDIKLVGGKGANLGEMYNAKFPVPQAFVITTDSFNYFLEKTKLDSQIKELLSKIDVDNTEDLQQKSKEIRELIVKTDMPKDLENNILEAYDNFNVDLDNFKDSPGALAILRSSREAIFVSVRSSATAEDLGGASFAGQQESFINVKGNEDVIEKVKRVFASIFTARSIFYRKKKGFDSFVGIAAVVQKMINSDKSGVMFSRNPITGDDKIMIESVWGQGEGIVSGKIKPDQHIVDRNLEIVEEHISDKKVAVTRTGTGLTKTIELTPQRSKQKVLQTHELKQLAEYAIKLEEHYNTPQDTEFAICDDEIFILQTRPITTIKEQSKSQEIDGQLISEGLAASPGVASGVVKIIHSAADLSKIKSGDILVTTMTNPDMVVSMQKASAIVTSEGGVTAHAAIVSREMGIPAVVGAQNALDVLDDGMEITVDGYHGKIFSGVAENRSVEIEPIVNTKTKIKVMVDLPKFASRAAKTNADGIGLIRLEGLIASGGKHPLYYEQKGAYDEYSEMLKTGLKEISEHFVGKPIWIRTSDIRSDEYSNLEGAPKEIEKNPMLGFHGIRFSLKHKDLFKAELRAVKGLAELGHKCGVMFPQIISPEEVKKTKEIFKEVGCEGKVQFGVMVETPAAATLIKDICELGIDFISFGTNDLTQYTLAIDRGNEDVQYLYDENNWAVLKLISRVIRECQQHNVETSICGQAGSKPEIVKFLVQRGISSISVNADVARDISLLVQKLETGEDVDLTSWKADILQESKGGNEKMEEMEVKEDVSMEESPEMSAPEAPVEETPMEEISEEEETPMEEPQEAVDAEVPEESPEGDEESLEEDTAEEVPAESPEGDEESDEEEAEEEPQDAFAEEAPEDEPISEEMSEEEPVESPEGDEEPMDESEEESSEE